MASAGKVRLEAVKILYRVLQNDAYADILIHETVKNRSFSYQDRALLYELVYGTLRWHGRLIYLLSHVYHGHWNRLNKKIQIVLALGLYQIIYLDRIPDFAAIHESVQIARQWGHFRWTGLVNALLRRLSKLHPSIELPDIRKNPVQGIAVRNSYPEWLVEDWINRHGIERTLSMCRACNEKPVLSVRTNILMNEPSQLSDSLHDLGYELIPGEFLREFFTIPEQRGLFETSIFKSGCFTVQDESAGFVSRLVDPKPDEIIFDMAAAPGGKSGHMAELSGNRALILSMDRHYSRLVPLRENVKRLGYKHVFMIQGDGLNPPVRQVDKVLIDAPCSGLGTLRKRPELRWKMNKEKIQELNQIQKQLLQNAVNCCSSDGIIVYSTCSVMKQENQEIAEWFLSTYPEFRIESAVRWNPRAIVNRKGWIETWPDIHRTDGAFAVRFKRGVN